MSSVEQRDFELMPHQTEALCAIDQAQANGASKMLLEMATGLGKTVVSANKVAAVIEKDPDTRALYLCHRVGILKQSMRVFHGIVGDSIDHGLMAGGETAHDSKVVFGGFQTMNSTRQHGEYYKMFSPDHFKILVVDESHHGRADTYQSVIEHFQPEILLGKTAVPNRMDGRDISEIFGETVYKKTLPEGIREGILAPFEYRVYSDSVRQGSAVKDLTLGQLNRRLFIPKRDEEIVSIFAKELEQIDKPHALIFCKSIAQAERMYRLMAKTLPYTVAPIHSAQSRKGHDYLVEAFRNGSLQIATVVDEYNEGMDVPSLNFLGFLRNTASEAVWLNQLGRGLRSSEAKSAVRVVDLATTLNRIKMINRLNNQIKHQKPGGEATEIDIYPRVKFEFSREVEDALGLVDSVRKKIEAKKQARQKEKEIRERIEYEPLPLPHALCRAFENGRRHEGKGVDIVDWSDNTFRLQAQRPIEGRFYRSQVGEVRSIIFLEERGYRGEKARKRFYLEHKSNRIYKVCPLAPHNSEDLYYDAKDWFLPSGSEANIKEADSDDRELLQALLNLGAAQGWIQAHR